ncbi:MAG TPA: MFS transporter [Anaerolineaceae bacterium]|nr:MFS transporter [Anaerolineaceae bacterium]
MSSTHLLLRAGPLLGTYAERVRAFHPNARLYLTSVVFTGAAFGVYRLLFNFYVLSLGFDEAFLGTLITTSSLTALLVALPMGYLADYLGHKPALLLGSLFATLAVIGVVAWPNAPVLIAMNVLLGLSQSLTAVTMGPFLMENSGETERTYLFSFASGFQTASAFVGNWIGGYLPTWVGAFRQAEPTSMLAYNGSLWVIGLATVLSALPLLFLRTRKSANQPRSLFAPITYFRSQPALLGRLILPMLVTSIGAGLIMPFMNVFYRQVYHQPDPVIGSMFAWGSLAMGIGLLIAPPLAERFGKIQVVVISQALSIPFLALLGFSPWFALSAAAYYFRLALMNMSGPVYQTFVMERVEPSARATVASLVSMASSFGWAFSPTLSGWLQVRYGFGPAYAGTILLYVLSIYLYWRYFWRSRPVETRQPAEGVTFRPQAHRKD